MFVRLKRVRCDDDQMNSIVQWHFLGNPPYVMTVRGGNSEFIHSSTRCNTVLFLPGTNATLCNALVNPIPESWTYYSADFRP